MKLQQLKFFCAVADNDFNMSVAAEAMHSSQPSISRHILELEAELGVALFIRRQKRLHGLTSPGIEALKIARRMMQYASNMRQIGEEFSAQNCGRLLITTTHTHAQYVLPKVIREFTTRYPGVQVIIRQGNPLQSMQWVATGEADLSITSDPIQPVPDLVLLPCYENPIVVLTRTRHPILRQKKLTIQQLATLPLITYNPESSTYAKVNSAFASANIVPNIVLSATDVDVMKTYVKQGLGVAVATSLGYQPRQDKGIKSIDVRHLFGSANISVGVRRYNYLRSYALDFISMFSPSLTKQRVQKAIHTDVL